jgi:heat shock protein HslJ
MVRAVLLLAAVLLAGCAAGAGTSDDVDGEWELAEGTADGAPLPRPPGHAATLRLADGEASGTSFCNHYSATYSLDGDAVVFEGLGGTEMGCEPDVMAAESAYLTALAAVDTVAIEDGGLALRGDGVELRFTPVAPVPDSPLEGTRWVLETVVEGETASSTVGEPALLELRPDGAYSASTGCRSLAGTWRLAEDSLVFDVHPYDTVGCPAPVDRQDRHVLDLLGGRPTVAVTEDRLTLTGDGRGLVYRTVG